MSYQLKIMKDYPIGFWPLDESSGTIAADRSGCGNNGTYTSPLFLKILPIVPGGLYGTKITNSAFISFPITNDYYAKTAGAPFGNKDTSDNDFTIEAWVSSSINSSAETVLFADDTNNIGLFWENGDVIFRISGSDEIRHTLTYTKKAIHLVGIYSVYFISLYVDGIQVATKTLDSFKFTNSSVTLTAGPTTDSGDYFIIDAPAVYRYSLPANIIKSHYLNGNSSISPIHVVSPEGGILFTCTDSKIKSKFDYSYPVDKQWTDFIDTNTFYDTENKYIGFYKTDTAQAKTFIINDSFLISPDAGLESSKVEWRNNLGITVESSIDGTNYVQCVNGQPLPQYTKESFATETKIYIRITMSTSDASKFLPRLSFFCISFYGDKRIYSDNYGDYISSSNEYYLGAQNYPILSRNYMNGIRAKNSAGFDLSASLPVRSVEMVFTPLTLASNTLFYASAGVTTRFAWNGSGAISKANIKNIYINNIDVSSATNISSYLTAGEPHHIVISFTDPVSGLLKFNYETSGGPSNLYKNIAIYQNELSLSNVETHYELYAGQPVETVLEPAINMTESAVEYYNNDWIVIQTV